MELRLNNRHQQIRPNSLSDPREKSRVLAKYAGIFPNNISEFASKVVRKHKKRINYSK